MKKQDKPTDEIGQGFDVCCGGIQLDLLPDCGGIQPLPIFPPPQA